MLLDPYLLAHADEPDTRFVFPTEVSASQWADRLLELKGEGSVALERFVAWDTFKTDSIRSEMQDKPSIPPALRKIFAASLVGENAARCAAGDEPLFAALFPPEYADTAASFAPWVASLLPSLGSWLERVSGGAFSAQHLLGGKEYQLPARCDGEDRDLYLLAARYARFLRENGLFEPAWEKPPFDSGGKRCFVFFPEALADFVDYAGLLESAPNVALVRLPLEADEAGENRAAFCYGNSRMELRRLADYVRQLAEEKRVPWERIAVSVPDAAYEPYLLREFALRNIPAVRRSAKPLSAYPAGAFFSALAACASERFSFPSVSRLLLNPCLPWRDARLISRLVEFGIRNNCLASWDELVPEGGEQHCVDVWEDAFGDAGSAGEAQAASFYRALKRRVTALVGAASFAEIRAQYFAFRERFWDDSAFLPETDLILSRCLSELAGLIDIEQSFPNTGCAVPFAFFAEHLGEKLYLAEQKTAGVNILPYRLAASAPFDCHIVAGASQRALAVIYARLGFLRQTKRSALGLQDDDASKAFIRLYGLSSKEPAAFFCAEETFDGYAIPHSALGVHEKRDFAAPPAPDPYAAEATALITGDAALFPPRLFSAQQEGFAAWLSANQADMGEGIRDTDNAAPEAAAEIPDTAAHGTAGAGATVQPAKPASAPLPLFSSLPPESLRERVQRRFLDPETGRVRVSATALADFVACPRRWLCARVFGVEPAETDAEPTANTAYGVLYHDALRRFFAAVQRGGGSSASSAGILSPLCAEGELPDGYAALLERACGETLASLDAPELSVRLRDGGRKPLSPVSARLLRAQKGAFLSRLESCVAGLLKFCAGFRVAAVEQDFEYVPEGKPYSLRGQIDCVLLRNPAAGAEPVIIDFKTNRLPARADCVQTDEAALRNFQLPAYALLYERNAGVPADAALFFSVGEAKPLVLFGELRNAETGKASPQRGVIFRDDAPDSPYRRIMDELAAQAERYAGAVLSGDFSLSRTPGWEDCAACAFRFACRTTYTVFGGSRTTEFGVTL